MNDLPALPREHLSEQCYLGAYLRYPEQADELFSLGVRDGDIVDLFHQQLHKAIREQHQQGGINIELLRARLKPETSASDFSRDYFDELELLGTTTATACFETAKIIEARRKRDRHDHHQTLATHALNGWTAEQLDRANEAALYDWKREREATSEPDTFTLPDLCKANPTLNPPIIDGLLRQGETCNIIADSKAGKSWLGYGLLWSIVTGQHWLGKYKTTPGRVLLIDNELHRSTLANRIPSVAAAMGIDAKQHGADFEVRPLRGRLKSLADIAADLEEIEPNTYAAILLDAKYRFIERGVSENENGSETWFYNTIDRIAEQTRAAVVLIHHASKGDQSGKKITDVGSGAGAQSRATDCHLVLRPHEEPGVSVIEAVVRSFAPAAPLPVRWEFPLWLPEFGVDPGKLKGRQGRNEERQNQKDQEGIDSTLTALVGGPATARQLRRSTGFGEYRQKRIIDLLISRGDIIPINVKLGNSTHEEYQLKQ